LTSGGIKIKALGLSLIIYALIVFYCAIKKPIIIWNSFKVKTFVKFLGEKGTIFLFYVLSGSAILLGFLLLL